MDVSNQLYELIKNSKRVIVLTGAGVSTGSGIPDYRSKDGIYNKGLDPEMLLSVSAFNNNYDNFFEFMRYMFDSMKDKEPNVIHEVLNKMIDLKMIMGLITQNIDSLHLKNASKLAKEKIYEFHGNIFKWRCEHCGEYYKIVEFPDKKCLKCGKEGGMRPNIVLYEELIDPKVKEDSFNLSNEADLIIAIGTSLEVYPFAGLAYSCDMPDMITKLVIVNLSETCRDNYSDIKYEVDAIEVFQEIKELMIKDGVDFSNHEWMQK